MKAFTGTLAQAVPVHGMDQRRTDRKVLPLFSGKLNRESLGYPGFPLSHCGAPFKLLRLPNVVS
jgi:hypothetical protein